MSVSGSATLEGAFYPISDWTSWPNNTLNSYGLMTIGFSENRECITDIFAEGSVDGSNTLIKSDYDYRSQEKTCSEECITTKSSQHQHRTIPDYWFPPLDESCPNTPLIIDLAGNEFHLGKKGESVQFDFSGDGIPEQTQWVKAQEDDAFIFLDLNENGLVDNGQELFGNYSPIILPGFQGLDSYNGYIALGQYDDPALGGNLDGLFSQKDQYFKSVKLWLDENADGICTPDEVFLLDEVGIENIDLISKSNRRTDQSGNHYYFWSWGIVHGRQVKVTDIYFKSL